MLFSFQKTGDDDAWEDSPSKQKSAANVQEDDGACPGAEGDAQYTEVKDQKDVRPKKGKKSSKGKDDADYEIMLDISKSMSNISSLAQKTKGESSKPPCDSHELWAQLLAIKLRQLKKKQAEQFKNKVDGMILEMMPDDSDD